MNLCDSHICTGCGACVNTCPVACIQMKRDAQGFDFPEIEKNNALVVVRAQEFAHSFQFGKNIQIRRCSWEGEFFPKMK